MAKTALEIKSLIVGTFETTIGQKLLEHLKETIVDRPTYKKGMELDEVAFREGQKDLVVQLMKEMS